MKNNDCVFCKIANKEIPVNFIHESENFVVFPDKSPVTKGHCLIVSKKHFTNLLDLPNLLANELVEVIKNVAESKLKNDATGFNIKINNFPDAGQVVMHFHTHLIPRKKGDSL